MRRVITGMISLLGILFSAQATAQNVSAKPVKPVAETAAETAAEKTEIGKREIALISTMILKVINPADARVALEEKVAGLGGFPILLTDESLQMKVPPEHLSKILAAASEQGLVIEKSLAREDLTLEIAEIEGALKSKLEILNRLRGFFDDSNLSATLRIEQTMNELVFEIETIKGRLRVIRDRTKWALVDIYFQFKQRDRIIYVSSPFDWLNTVSLDHFLEEF
jgi:hypothetical protein